MPSRIEDYALIGDCQTVALVARDGSIDWLCMPHFDSGACFAALLGRPEHGRWLLAPAGEIRQVRRHYWPGTLILETEYETDDGVVAVLDFMPPRTAEPDLVRIVVGKQGRVPMRLEIIIRFDYGSIVPWVQHVSGGIRAVAGPDTLVLQTSVPLRGENLTTVSEFTVAAGQRVPCLLTWYPSHEQPPEAIDAEKTLESTDNWWQGWSGACTYEGPWKEALLRSLITLKALTYAPTGGIVAAATTSLPEQIGGVRNWDYRFCWLRDATFTLYALMMGGYTDEALAWRHWLLRAVAGTPSQLNIMYGIRGERRLTEIELPWLPGYESSSPVRIGNAAHLQFQLDVFGEVMDAMHLARRAGAGPEQDAWNLQLALMKFLETAWERPDDGIWEVRGPQRHFTHSKMMAWVAVDRMIKGVERFGLNGPVDRWRTLRSRIHDEVCEKGFDRGRNTFVQYYGSQELDASLLMMPLVGFLHAHDPRVRGTVEAIEKNLMENGFVRRYTPAPHVEGLPPGEGVFLPCSFWLADNWSLMGRKEEARELFERLLSLRNDVGLLSEEYDVCEQRLVGNFPQAFTHVGLVNSVWNLTERGPAKDRPKS